MFDMPDNSERRPSELLADISHELRTPLNAVLGMLELSLEESLSAVLKEYLTAAHQSARRLVAVVDDLADLGQVWHGELGTTPGPFGLRSIVELALAPLQAEAHARRAEATARVHPEVPDHLNGDGECLRKILAHLTAHVIKATDASRIILEIAIASRTEQAVELALGVGSDAQGAPDWLEHITVAPGGSDQDTRYPDSRLALAIARQWIEHMQGRMWIDPADPARVYATVTLELASEDGVGHSLASDPRAPSLAECQPDVSELTNRPLCVLVVDDTPANRKVVKAVLTRRGHNVQLADNGRQAVERVCQHAFDVVLMDAQMPAMSGLEAAARIRNLAEDSRAEVPIIAMTAAAMPDDRHRCLLAGMDDCLLKPVSAASLIRCIESYGNFRNVAVPAAALERLGGDEDLLHELIKLFQDDAPSLAEKVRAGLQSGDTEAAVRAAHSLRGLAANFDARPTIDAALAVERHAIAGNPRALAPALADLEDELAQLQNALRIYQRRQR